MWFIFLTGCNVYSPYILCRRGYQSIFSIGILQVLLYNVRTAYITENEIFRILFQIEEKKTIINIV